METSLKTGFAQIFSCCPKNLALFKIWGGYSPFAPRPVRLCDRLWDELVRRDEAIEQKGKLPEKYFVKNELQTPQSAQMTILVSLLHYNIVKKKIEFD